MQMLEFLDKHIYIDSFLHGHIKNYSAIYKQLKIAIIGENILFLLTSLCILLQESFQARFLCLLCLVFRQYLATSATQACQLPAILPSAGIIVCLTMCSILLFLKDKLQPIYKVTMDFS